MDKSEISKYRKLVNQHLDTHQLVLALKYLKVMVDDTQQWELSEELNRISTSYSYMLQYMTQGALDPQRDNILSQIIIDPYMLPDKTFIARAAQQSTPLFPQPTQQ